MIESSSTSNALVLLLTLIQERPRKWDGWQINCRSVVSHRLVHELQFSQFEWIQDNSADSSRSPKTQPQFCNLGQSKRNATVEEAPPHPSVSWLGEILRTLRLQIRASPSNQRKRYGRHTLREIFSTSMPSKVSWTKILYLRSDSHVSKPVTSSTCALSQETVIPFRKWASEKSRTKSVFHWYFFKASSPKTCPYVKVAQKRTFCARN